MARDATHKREISKMLHTVYGNKERGRDDERKRGAPTLPGFAWHGGQEVEQEPARSTTGGKTMFKKFIKTLVYGNRNWRITAHQEINSPLFLPR